MERMTWIEACKKYPNHWIMMADPKYRKSGFDKILVDGIFEGAAETVSELMKSPERLRDYEGHVLLHSVRDKI